MSNMFTNRPEESGRRPSADFVARFKEQHFAPENRPLTTQEPLKEESIDPDPHDTGAMPQTMYDLDPTPRATQGSVAFRFTPSLLDPNSSAFAAFAAQPPGYYTPTPGGSTMAFQSYELPVSSHDAFGTNTSESLPQSNPTSTHHIFQHPMSTIDHGHFMHFRPHPYSQDSLQGLFIPGSAVGGAGSESSRSNYSPETASGAENTDPELYLASEVQGKSAFMHAAISRNRELCGQYIPDSSICSSPFSFRFGTTLHAATAMLRHSSDIPVTYLNKRQAYAISVTDSSPAVQSKEIKRYRTTIRIAFDEEDQRRTAPACWRLWKDGRGTFESGGNPDKLRAIDYEAVETRAVNEKKSNLETEVHVEDASTSFDRFTVAWSTSSPKPTVYFCVRFLFLSTDFSHSKGVKGVPVRLVSKTEYLGSSEPAFKNADSSELAYCKIKLFRDKGAERKLANDRQHLERAVEKLRQQAQQLTISSPDLSQQVSGKKKKRHSYNVPSSSDPSASPQRRHRRDWSISSAASTNSTSGNARPQEDEVQRKLDKAVAMEYMFASIRPTSAFSLIGDPLDDPGLSFSPIAPQSQWEAPGMGVPYSTDIEKLNLNTSTQKGSPALSQTSFSSATSDKLPYSGTSPPGHPLSPPEASSKIAGMMVATQLSQTVRVQAATKDIDALDVDPFYVPITPPTIRPALCLYIAPAKIDPNGDPYTMHLSTAIDPTNDIYHAVYVPTRTAAGITSAIATKMGFEPSSIVRTLIINRRDLRLALDDEVAREMCEKQDMRVAVREVEWHQADVQQDSAMVLEKHSGWELFLAF